MTNASYRGKPLILTLSLILSLTLSLSTEKVFAQAGSYYDAINPNSAAFISDLKNRVRVPYTKVSYDNFDETYIANFAAINNGNGTKSVICVYSGYEYIYSGVFTWGVMSREHTFCHSWMPSFSSTSGDEYADQHHLFPTHQNNANAVRSNHPLGKVTTVTSQFLDGKLGTNALGQLVYEPRDKQKGDAARALLYMMLRYDGIDGVAWNLNWLNNTRLPALNEAPQAFETLLNWHRQDPPDKHEVERGNYIQSVQQNRNPFTDRPEYVSYINFNNFSKLSPVYDPEPSNYPVSLVATSTSTSITVNWTDASGTQVPSGYLVQIFSKDDYFLPIDGEIYSDDTTLSDGKGLFNVTHTGGANGITFERLASGTAYYVTVYSYNGGGALRNYKINGVFPRVSKATGASTNTVVNFIGTTATVKEDTGSVTLRLGIINPSPTAATSVQVILISGDSSDINNYTAQTVIFPSGSAGDQFVTVDVTNDTLLEGDEAFVFKLQNISGGTNAVIGQNPEFSLIIRDDDLTTVQFTASSALANEGDGQLSLVLMIDNPNSIIPTTATVALVSGSPADLGGFTSQTVTFPAGSSQNQSVVITITDDNEQEPTEFFEFSIEDVSGGNSAQAGPLSLFTLTLVDNEAIAINLLDNFNRSSSNTLGGTPTSPVSLNWSETETVAGSAIAIDSSRLKISSGVSGKDFAYVNLSTLTGYNTVLNNANGLMMWAVNMKHTRPNPSGFDAGNYGIAFVLAKSTSSIDGGTGYAVVHGNSGSVDPIRLAKFNNGFASNGSMTNVIAGGAYGSGYHSIKVIFDPSNSSWALYADSSSAAFPYEDPRNTATLLGTAVDNTYTGTSLPYFGCLWNHNVTSSEFAVFDDIYISDPGWMLPVELVSFVAENIDGNVKLRWVTATEVNNRGFEIIKLKVISEKLIQSGGENSGEGKIIGFVSGAGSSGNISSYSFTDENVAPGEYRYRLKQVDNDGSFSFSNEVSVTVSSPGNFMLEQNYPNPFGGGNSVTSFRFYLPVSGNVKFAVYDVLGREIANLLSGKTDAGVHTVNYNAAKIHSGVYFYKITVTGDAGQVLFSSTRKMIVIK
ncbi:MAG: endonuclease [Ignavibacteriaceae bacterium]|nr:endonuclease [Ignavibacteriaceae bacterium]